MKKPTIKQLSTADLTAQKDSLTGEIGKARKELDKWNTTVIKLHDQLEAITDELDERELLSQTTSNWPFLLEEVGNTSMARYKAAQAAIAKIVPTIGGTGIAPIGFSGYLPSIQQRSIQISMIKGDHDLTIAAAKALEEQLLPHVKKVEHDEIGPHKHLGILEASLSEHGVYWIAIDEDRDLYQVHLTRYSNSRLFHNANSLLDLLTYVENHLAYKSLNGYSDDDY